jgi:glycosyltransferase involved in cell wall biosynthesis
MFKLSTESEIIYVTDTYSVGYFAYLIKKMTGQKYIVRFAGDSAWETATANGWTTDYITDFERKTYDRKIEKLKNRRRKILLGAERVIAVSRFMSDLAVMIGVKKDKIKVIYNSIDFMSDSADSVISEDALPKDGKIIMTSCRLTKWKGVDLLIKNIEEIQENGRVYLVIIGDGPESQNLIRLVKDRGVSDFVIFKGSISHEIVLYYYRKADVFVLNTNYEGLSHTLLEVMSAGVPIVATNVGGNPEVIENGVSGLLVEYGNGSQLKEAVIKILDDKNLSESLVRKAKEKLESFNWNSTVVETAKVIKSIL